MQPGSILEALEWQFEQFDWSHSFYDPMDIFNFELPEDPVLFQQLENLVNQVRNLNQAGGETAQTVQLLCEKYWRGKPMEVQIPTIPINHLNTKVMNEQNFEYLSDNIKYLGFGEQMKDALRQHMETGSSEFSLPFSARYDQNQLDADLHFKKSANSDMYFLNSYDAKLKNDVQTLSHSFKLEKGKGITMKEAYNLLEGRAVYKELTNRDGQQYHAWVKIDFDQEKENGRYKMKQFHDNYGFDLAKTLHQYPQIKELAQPELAERLIKSLQKGNEQSVELVIGDQSKQIKIAADPQHKAIVSPDTDFNTLKQEVRNRQQQAKGQAEESQPVQKNGQANSERPLIKQGESLKKKQTKSQRQSMS